MSTCISNGYILETSNSKKVNKVNERLRVIFNQILKKTLVSNISSLVSPIANYNWNQKSDCQQRNESYLNYLQLTNHELNNKAFELQVQQRFKQKEGSLFDFAKDVIGFMSEHNIRNTFSVNSEKIYFKTVGHVTLYYFAISGSVAKEFERINEKINILKDYEYYDNTDKPDDVTTKAWSHRIHTWDRVLNGLSNVSEAMYNIPLKVDFYDIRELDIITELPDEHHRLKSLYKRSRVNELGAQMRAEHVQKHGADLSTSEYSQIYFEVAEQVMEEIRNGVYTTSQKHLDMMISQDDFINSIFYEEKTYFKKEE